MPTELRETKHGRRLSRRVGSMIVTIDAEGVTLRSPRCRKRLFVPWHQVAKMGLQEAGYSLLAEEWERPLTQLKRLAKLPRAKGGGK